MKTKRYDFNGGVMMTASKKPTQSVPRSLDEDIADIEAMSDADIDRELREVHGIDPDRAVARIAASVREKMNAWDQRRHHHPDKETVVRRVHATHPITREE